MTDVLEQTPEVIRRADGGLRRLSLNRPGALNALSRAMIDLLTEDLLACARDPAVRLVLLDHAEGRGFCAGGDIRTLAESAAADGALARRFFFDEYRLNDLLVRHPKPIMAVMDGVTMGGGVGLSMPARFRVATERTMFAMPETGIGLFPDVGGGWWLSRLPGHSGMWLALTGARIKAADCLALGVATHYIQSDRLEAFKAALAADPAQAALALADFSSSPGASPAAARQAQIDDLFGRESVEAIIAALEADPSDFAAEALKMLATKSPQTLKVAFRQLRTAARAPTFSDNLAMEYRIACRVIMLPDFVEGVRALIVDKDNAPRWRPATVGGVTDALLDQIFAPLPAGQEWTPLQSIT
jgi:enoyl-CoA hydratase